MPDDSICPLPAGRCADLNFRLAVYEAGHALSARALGIKVLAVKMLPRPPTLESDKILRGNSLQALVDLLQNRCIELFGGQIAEEHACASASCCSGDVARIDELTRLIAGLTGSGTHEDVWFDLEDAAAKIFEDEGVRDAIMPIAEFLHSEVEKGRTIIPGADVEGLMDRLLGARGKPKRGGLFERFSRRGPR